MADRIKTLFLDIGGVLLTDGWGRASRDLAVQKFNLDKSEFEDRHSLVWSTYEADKMNLDDYLRYVIFYQKRDFSADDFKSFMMSESVPLDGALDYFKGIKKQYGYKVAALSNESRELNDYRIKKFKLDELFDFFVSSCYVGLRKPDPAMYKLAIDLSQTPKENALYIDDRIAYIELATSLGIPSLHYTGMDSAKQYFDKRQ